MFVSGGIQPWHGGGHGAYPPAYAHGVPHGGHHGVPHGGHHGVPHGGYPQAYPPAPGMGVPGAPLGAYPPPPAAYGAPGQQPYPGAYPGEWEKKN